MAHNWRSEDNLRCWGTTLDICPCLQLCFEIGYLVCCYACQIRWPTSFKVVSAIFSSFLPIKYWDYKNTEASALCGFQGSDPRSSQALYSLSHFQSLRILYNKSSRNWRWSSTVESGTFMSRMKVKSWVPSLIQRGKIFNFQFYGDENNDMKKRPNCMYSYIWHRKK